MTILSKAGERGEPQCETSQQVVDRQLLGETFLIWKQKMQLFRAFVQRQKDSPPLHYEKKNKYSSPRIGFVTFVKLRNNQSPVWIMSQCPSLEIF